MKFKITIDFDSETRWLIARAQCLVRGHEWVDAYVVRLVGLAGHEDYEERAKYKVCSRCGADDRKSRS